MNLNEQQEVFWRAVHGQVSAARLHATFKSEGALDAERRLEIYRRMYAIRLRQVLVGCFPELLERLGHVEFRRLAQAYIDRTDSSDPRIEFYGQRLPEFLVTHSSVQWRGLAPVAALDWARCHAVLAEDPEGTWDATQLDPDGFASSCIVFIPSLTLVDMAPGGPRVVWRRDVAVREMPLDVDEAKTAALARRGQTIAQICEVVHQSNGRDEHWLAKTLANWASRGWVADLSVATNREARQ